MNILQELTDRLTDILNEVIQGVPHKDIREAEFKLLVTPDFSKQLARAFSEQVRGTGNIKFDTIKLITGNVIHLEVDLDGVNCVEDITREILFEPHNLSDLRGKHTKQTEKEIDDQIKTLREEWER